MTTHYPKNLKYTKEHEWIQIEGSKAFVGVTHYALEQLGDVVYLELPKIGAVFKANESFGTIESTKTVSDLYCPIDCKVIAIHQEVVDSPDGLLKDPYEKGWLIEVEVLSSDFHHLLNCADYIEYIQGQS